MLDLTHLPPSALANQQIFYTQTPTAGTNWQVWNKPRGISFVHFFVLGGGGGGGAGAPAGAASTSAGGGGGGSSAQCSFMFPAWALPEVLFISVGYGGPGGITTAGTAGNASYISIYPTAGAPTVNYVLAQANGGGAGGVGVGATAGAAGAAGTVTAIGSGPLAGLGFPSWGNAATNISLVGQAGIIGGTTVAGGALTLPVTGLVVTGGTGGGGLGAAASTGAAGGSFTVPAGSVFPAQPGGAAGGTTTASGGNGSNGFQAIPKLLYFYGGTGGASSGGAGGSGGIGGRGGYGCGGGGGGGTFTGGTQARGGAGGDGLVIATAW